MGRWGRHLQLPMDGGRVRLEHSCKNLTAHSTACPCLWLNRSTALTSRHGHLQCSAVALNAAAGLCSLSGSLASLSPGPRVGVGEGPVAARASTRCQGAAAQRLNPGRKAEDSGWRQPGP